MTPPKRSARIAAKRLRAEQQSQDVKEQQKDMAATMTSIPYNVLVHIFQYLKVHELLKAAQVCTVWRDTVASRCLWKMVRIDTHWCINLKRMADTLKKRSTQYLSLDDQTLVGNEFHRARDALFWLDLLNSISQVSNLVKLELCGCPAMSVEAVIKSCPQLKVLNVTIKEFRRLHTLHLNLKSVDSLIECQEFRLRARLNIRLVLENLTSLQKLEQLTQLSLTSVYDPTGSNIKIIQTLTNLEILELGCCTAFPDNFGTSVLIKFNKLKCLRLEHSAKSYFTLDILEGVSKLQNLSQIELLMFHVDNGFDECLAKCKNIKRLLIVPTRNIHNLNNTNDEEYYRKILPNLIREGVMRLSNTLKLFIWGILKKREFCDWYEGAVYLNFIGNFEKEKKSLATGNDRMKMSYFEELLSTDLPKTRVKIVSVTSEDSMELRISDIARRGE